MQYTDRNGKNPLSDIVLKELILGEDFLVAWWTVCVYIMQMDLQDFHKELMLFQYNNKNSLVMAGRGFGKSYLLNTAYTLTLILRDPHIRIAVATQSLAQSKKFVGEMKRYFEKGTVIHNIFGDLKGDIWTETQFSLKRDRVIKEASVSAGSMGASANFISSHFDILILDDIVGEENSASKTQRDKLKTFIFNTVLPTLEMQNGYGWVHCIGTHYHPSDFWTTIIESNQYSVLKKESLFIDPKTGKERSIWEWKKGVEELKKIRELVGSIIFNMQYQQKVPKAKGNIFKPEWIQYYNKYSKEKDGIYVYRREEEEEKKEKVRVYMGVDLAISQKQSADSFVICTIGIGINTGYIYLLDMYRGKLSFNEQIEKIKEMANKWDTVERIGIESVAYQQALPGELIRTTMLPVIKIQTITDKVTRMNKFSGQWENFKVFLYSHIKDLHILEEETLNFPEAEHDDTIDAFEIAFQTAQKNRKKLDFTRDMFRR
ncbi:phage uncharacterized protein (putative large terminase), C-terminal domain-containing protein [Alkalithermobacter thermoalcaliphilus JW-YL-7 = DSM 7308]|uniref:Phage uncharacterized protein n=1 Tax=Alkalithermobacter thermoalcaliphilus JW-YL-7 = DSM 7308 TaxID=1121328 RepID=A0A150FPB1_CLOPD|nr:phage uncharacterized protein [[Clostridium] paradoxum JW-YL-7 = DSM 7308]SHK50312.1 phage uncharacterized protein (putative large terminase), C-terminal domain-containing protein [[Clostridium] paradoxum JW-YL-7 = DSM 7308]